MSDKTYVLSLSADTFNAFKMDFDSALQRLLQKMDRLQSDSASINCKISVALTPAPERNFDATREGDTVQVMKPSFRRDQHRNQGQGQNDRQPLRQPQAGVG